jgi:membrane associated rhomboid family serine protease
MPQRESERDAEQATLDEFAGVAQREPDSTSPLAPTHALRVYGFTPASPSALTAATHVFLHAGWIHFLAIVPLWFFLTASAELRWGASRFAVFTLSAAVVSAGIHALLEPNSAMSLLGAAGPTAALLSLFFLQYRMEPVRVVAVIAAGALPLPDPDAARGRPFRVFKFLRGYQRQVLKVDC